MGTVWDWGQRRVGCLALGMIRTLETDTKGIPDRILSSIGFQTRGSLTQMISPRDSLAVLVSKLEEPDSIGFP